MSRRLPNRIVLVLNLALAYTAGVISILGFFTRGPIADLGGMLAQWVAVIVGFALLVGLGNLLKVHIGRVVKGQKDWFYSLVLVSSAATTLARFDSCLASLAMISPCVAVFNAAMASSSMVPSLSGSP